MNMKKVVCIETGEIFDSITEAAKFCGRSAAEVHKVVKGKSKTTAGYTWQYYDEWLIKPKKSQVRPPIICIETGELFKTAAEAGEKMGINPDLIRLSVDLGWNANGYTFKAYTDVDNVIAKRFDTRKTKEGRKYTADELNDEGVVLLIQAIIDKAEEDYKVDYNTSKKDLPCISKELMLDYMKEWEKWWNEELGTLTAGIIDGSKCLKRIKEEL